MATFDTLDGTPTLVFAHRGASGYRPEHTLEAYRLAIELGADFIEPDVVASRDGVLFARHENTLSDTTDVADRPEFADRRVTKQLDGRTVTDWFSEDFTAAELKTLFARERLPEARPDSAAFDDRFRLATLDEVIALVREVEAETGRAIGIAPETKHPTHFLSAGRLIDGSPINIDLSDLVVERLVAAGFTDPERVWIQSFESGNLRALHERIMPDYGVDLPLLQLGNTSSLEGLRAIAEYADAVGPSKDAIFTRTALPAAQRVDADGDGVAEVRFRLTGNEVPIIDNAHSLGLKVIPYTVRADEQFLSLNPDGSVQTAEQELLKIIRAGADGVFTDFTDTGREAVDAVLGIGASAGADTLSGGTGQDYLAALAGDDLLRGQGGDDWLSGGAGNDRLDGGAGADTLIGGTGSDRLFGGGGDDSFLFRAGDLGGARGSADHVTDFAAGDVLMFEGFGAGAGLRFDGYGATRSVDAEGRASLTENRALQYYRVVDGDPATADGFVLVQKSDGALLGSGDYAFM